MPFIAGSFSDAQAWGKAMENGENKQCIIDNKGEKAAEILVCQEAK
jgi:hypothetical protein